MIAMVVENEYSPLDISLFENCASDDINEIEQEKKTLTFSNGECIFRENSPALGVFCLMDGGAKMIKEDIHGKERIVSLAKKGDVLGLRTVINKTDFSASAIAFANTCCCFIPQKNILAIIERCPNINLKIMISLCKELDEIEEKITSLTHKSVVKRVAEILLILLNNYGIDKSHFLEIMPAWDDLASMANITRTTLARVLNEFKEKGMIAIQNQRIRIFNSDLLAEIAG